MTFTSEEGAHEQRMDASGRFVAALSPGTYTVTGTSPSIGPRPCTQPATLVVPPGGPASVRVVCSVP